MIVLFLIVACLYLILIIRYIFGWIKIIDVEKNEYFPSVSIVIAMRNQELEIVRLLKSLKSQIYPKEKIEFILVNDHSSDSTYAITKEFKLENLNIINMPEGIFGKKNAISKGVSSAKGKIILVSDADCFFSPNWTKKMVSYFSDENINLVSGPVTFKKKKGFFQKFQALEFISLIGSGAGAIANNNPIFCNGANMAYRKNIFLELNDYDQENIVSGDDVFLLHSIKRKYNNSIVFAKDKDAIVTTDSIQNFSSFINQRNRWVSKSSNYKDVQTIYVSFLILFMNLMFIFLFMSMFINKQNYVFFLAFYFLKYLVDFFLLYPVLIFFDRKDLIKWIFPFEFFYSFYIILIVVVSFFKKFEWKDRMYNR